MRKLLTLMLIFIFFSSAASAQTRKNWAAQSPSTSLQMMLNLMTRFAKANRKSMLETLRQAQLRPLVVEDLNPQSGALTFVRLEQDVPGIRYFHAQFFEDSRPQHISFEYQPGSSAFEDTERRLRYLIGRPVVQTKDFIKWKFKNGLNLWMKRMQTDDLGDDPFNAYTMSDLGTIRIVLESDVHSE